MCRHVVWTFLSMHDPGTVFRNDPPEEFDEVALHLLVGILLYEDRCRGVLAEKREQARPDTAPFHESLGLVGEFIEPLPLRRHREPLLLLLHDWIRLFRFENLDLVLEPCKLRSAERPQRNLARECCGGTRPDRDRRSENLICRLKARRDIHHAPIGGVIALCGEPP